ncbi:MAG: YHS domain-containing protein [Bacteroidetes bacterium]|nr:YHS domain-containing protein [Bacteroidota bacterium]
MNIDPVCGMEITNKENAETFEYNGKTYYFCSSHCLNQFLSVLITLTSEINKSENDYYLRLMK